MAGVAVDVSASRAMDRLVRSRLWIAIIALGLTGLVAMQVSLLKLNSGIGRAVQASSTLERSNSAMRADISRMSAGDQIQQQAQAAGLQLPAPSDITYLRAGDARADAASAAQTMSAPDQVAIAALAGATPQTAAPASTTTPAAAPTRNAAPAAATTSATTPPAAQSTAAATGATQATANQSAAPPSADQATAGPTGTSSGGAAPTTTP
jgi:hypothetical protein